MKHLFIILIVFLSAISISAQVTYESLIENKALIDVKKEKVLLPTTGEYWETQSFDKLRAILSNDLFAYYGLNEEYSTPLKKQAFQKTSEYINELLPAFNKIRQSVKNANFYVLFNLHWNEAYNISTRCFNFRIGVNDYNTTTTPGYIGLGNSFCVSFPQSRTKIKKSRTSHGDYFLQQYITTSTIPEDIALRIENEFENPYCSVELMFIVKPTKISKEQLTMNFGGYVGVQTIVNQNILANTIGLYIVDTKTKEILCDLSKILAQQSTQSSRGNKKK